MSRSLQDQFIDDDEEETCPLCVEEFDLTDKGFRPCPCGYQICQFCYHNVKNNMNGLCPACRRPYREENIEYKVITPEETAAHKARQSQKQKKTQAALQKEKQKAEADNLSRKHLAGLRVVQKNLVYVTGLSPSSQEDQLLQTLRGDQYFGQYGKIIKIVVSKAKDPSYPQSVGVYVTYERKEDAAKCIVAVDGSKNGERTLRAQFGTTKYCSAYLRGETCANRNCMFLHEPGEANESYSRADLSALNAGSSQHGTGRPPPPQSQQPVASAAQPAQTPSHLDESPPSPSASRPALPSTASWASKSAQAFRVESRPASVADSIPRAASPPPPPSTTEAPSPAPPIVSDAPAPIDPVYEIPETAASQRKQDLTAFINLLKDFTLDDFHFTFAMPALSQHDIDIINHYPPLFDDVNGAEKRRARKEHQRKQFIPDNRGFQHVPMTDADDALELSSGSLQLGGEPEDRQNQEQLSGNQSQTASLDQQFHFTGASASEHGLTQQQHQQMLLQTLKPSLQEAYSSPVSQAASFQSSAAQSNNPSGHQRNLSRFSFANDSGSASTAVKPVANPKLMNQQSTMMPPANNHHFASQHQQLPGQFYTSNVQGPPPGLKTTGTPPVSGNLTFGQGHGFATGGLPYGANANRNQQDSYYRELLRREGGGAGGGSGADAKLDQDFPPLGAGTAHRSAASRASLDESRRSTPPVPPGFEQAWGESRKSTPSIPPGLGRPTALPDLDAGSQPSSRPASRTGVKRMASYVVPALPLRPATPSLPATPSKLGLKDSLKSNTAASDTLPSALASAEPSANSTTVQNSTDVADQHDKQQVEAGQELTDITAAEGNTKTVSLTATPEVAKATPQTSQPPIRTPVKQNKDIQPAEAGIKKQHPGKLDIAAAVIANESENASISSPVELSTPIKATRPTTQTPSTLSARPGSPSINAASPAVKPAPRTLRVVQTPKAETPPPLSAVAHKLPSRKPSVASINLPGTPTSELVSMSDNVSITSTSLSRANSPPPLSSKVGSAPVRAKTKNQMKKERQERARAIEEEKALMEEAEKPAEEEPAQEAIVARKKKAKKEKEPKSKPKPAPEAELKSNRGNKAVAEATAIAPPPPPPQAEPVQVVSKQSNTPTAIPAATAAPQQNVQAPAPILLSRSEPSPPATPTLTAAQLVAELKAAGPERQKSIESFFRIANGNHSKNAPTIAAKDLTNPASWRPDFKINLTKDEVDSLLKGKVSAVHYAGSNVPRNSNTSPWDRGMVTPSGAHIRALPKELESRFLDLEKVLRDTPEEFRFRPSKPQNEMKLPAVDLAALKRQFETAGGRGVNAMEQMVTDGTSMKKGAFLVDEASKYINEFVMPPATPPPSVATGGAGARGGLHMPPVPNGAAGYQQAGGMGEANLPSLDNLERQLMESRRYADEKENALRKVMKKNKKLLGMS